jgi:4-hydroxybenzoyl-CoA reductase subunit alpha
MRSSGWKEKFRKQPFGKGIGAACGFYISGSALPIIWNEYPQSVVHLKTDFDGRVVIYSGASDIGQGSDTVLSMIVAETLGIPLSKTFIHAADTRFTPVDLGSYSSRVTFMAGNAAKMAAENLKKKISVPVSEKLNLPEASLVFKGGYIRNEKGENLLNWDEAIEIATAHKGALNSSGWYESPKLGGNFKGSGAGLSPSYSFGSVIAEVEVNTGTGKVAVKHIHGAHDCGKALNPLAVEGQLEGSWHMGMGQALSECMVFHEGLLVNSGFLDYKIPMSKDNPEYHTHIIESNDPEGPYGGKECGEGALHPVIPAIANAVYDAVGVRIRKLPIDPREILDALKKPETERAK